MHTIHMGNGEAINITHVRTSNIQGKRRLYLNNLSKIPQIKRNLMSVYQFANDNNVYLEFHPKFLLTQDISLRGKLDRGLYKFDFGNTRKSKIGNMRCDSFESCIKNDKETFDPWHCKLGHASVNVVKQVFKNNNISFDVSLPYVCTYCRLGKSHRLPFADSNTIISKPLELVATDL